MLAEILHAQTGSAQEGCGVRTSGGRGPTMGMVISFPAVERTARGSGVTAGKSQSATVVILPVIRIERYVEEPASNCEPATSRGPHRRRRRRASRS
jgi:hypothetical protein